jgi:DNA mismatch repair protein MutS
VPRPNRDTPAMRQYDRFKREHPGCLLLFRMGDFYELFDQDAVTAHRALGITLTERTKGQPMAGVPYHAVEGYLRRLVDQGFRVAVCEQLQDPAEAKGVVERGVTRVLTPGTLVDESLLDDGTCNRVCAAFISGQGAGAVAAIAVAELSTGEFQVEEAPALQLQDLLARVGARELLLPEAAELDSAHPLARARRESLCPVHDLPGWMFRPKDASALLKEHFGVIRLDAFDLHDDDPSTTAAGALLRYLLDTQRGVQADPASPSAGSRASARPLAHLRSPRRMRACAHLLLDATTLRSLEIERTLRSGGTDGTVLSVLGRPCTAMGKRLLREWLCAPLAEMAAIQARQAEIATLVTDERMRRELRAAIDPVQDVARIAGRMALGRATPRDLVALGKSVGQAPSIQSALGEVPSFQELRQRIHTAATALAPIAANIARACVAQPPSHLREGGLFREGFDAALDEFRTLQRDASQWMARYQETLARDWQIPSLKIGFNRVFGYYIEVTHAHASKVPATVTRRQTLRNAERYITPELKEFEDKVLSAESRGVSRERALFEELCAQAAKELTSLADLAEAVAHADCIATLAETAAQRNWVRPELVDGATLELTASRHPVLDEVLKERFVPNHASLGTAAHPATLALITGPNMAGKSTYIRQVALAVMLAHVGSFVPAEHAVIGLADRIFTRIGASDELHSGQSTFMVEMTETARILNHATAKSVVVLDEIGRGTSTHDGLSLAWAIAEHLAVVGARTLFATHYHELTQLPESFPTMCNLHVSVREWKDDIIFLHRIMPGATDRSYGIHVAKLAGVPASVVERARLVLALLEGDAPATSRVAADMPLFAHVEPHPAITMLNQLNLDALTPLQAFDALRALKERT